MDRRFSGLKVQLGYSLASDLWHLSLSFPRFLRLSASWVLGKLNQSIFIKHLEQGLAQPWGLKGVGKVESRVALLSRAMVNFFPLHGKLYHLILHCKFLADTLFQSFCGRHCAVDKVWPQSKLSDLKKQKQHLHILSGCLQVEMKYYI